jgi:hypothetical protein
VWGRLTLCVLCAGPPLWLQAMDEMIAKLVFTSPEGYTYVAEFDRNQVKHKFDHLVCFVPGMLALGAHSGAVGGAKAERYVELAGALTHTCWQMYHRMPSGGGCGLRPGWGPCRHPAAVAILTISPVMWFPASPLTPSEGRARQPPAVCPLLCRGGRRPCLGSLPLFP